MSVEIEIQHEGCEELAEKFERLDSAIKNHVQRNLQELGVSIKEKAQELAPSRTGYLRSTIFAEIKDWTVRVGANAPYAYYVEFGTRFMQPRRFLTRALESHLHQIAHTFECAVNDAIKEVETT